MYKDKQNCFELVIFLFYLAYRQLLLKTSIKCSFSRYSIYWYTKLGCYVDVKFEEFDDEFNAVFTSNKNQHLRDPLLS